MKELHEESTDRAFTSALNSATVFFLLGDFTTETKNPGRRRKNSVALGKSLDLLEQAGIADSERTCCFGLVAATALQAVLDQLLLEFRYVLS